MVKILDFNCVRNFWQRVMVYIISLIYTCLDFHWKFFSHKPLFISSTILLPIVTLRQPLKNKNLISLNWEKLLYNISDNLFSLTSKILGSYMWAFTVIFIFSICCTMSKYKAFWMGKLEVYQKSYQVFPKTFPTK